MGMVAEGFALVDVAQMDLNHGKLGRLEGIKDGNRGVAVGSCIDDDSRRLVARLKNPFDQFALPRRLPEVDPEAQFLGPGLDHFLDVLERHAAVNMRLTLAQKIEGRPVKDKYRFRLHLHGQKGVRLLPEWPGPALPQKGKAARRIGPYRRLGRACNSKGRLDLTPRPWPLTAMRLTINGEVQDLAGPLSVAGLLERLRVDRRKVAVERNLAIVPRAAYETAMLEEGDRIEIVAFIGGG